MADKQFALGGNRNASYVEDDDPLAELARIVGFQEQPAVQPRAGAAPGTERVEPVVAEFPSPVAPAATVAPQNPVADLEDELLRAFETYDAPRAVAPAVQAEPVVTQQAAAPSPAPDVAPVSDDDDDAFGALAAVVAASAPEPASAPLEIAPEPMAPRPPMRSLATPVLPQAQKPVEAPRVEPAMETPEFSVDLLEEELMQSLDEVIEPEVMPEPEQAVGALSRRPEPAFSEAEEFTDVTDIDWDFPGIDADDVVTLDPPEANDASVSLRPAPAQDTSMDALLDDVSRYAVPSAREPSQRREPAFDAALAAISGVATDLDSPARNFASAPSATPQEAAPAPVAPAAAAAEPDFGDFFTPTDFELDIDELEQQLTDMSFEDVAPRAETRASAAPGPLHLEPFADFVPESAAEEGFVAAPVYHEPVRQPAPPQPEPVVGQAPVQQPVYAQPPVSVSIAPAAFAPQAAPAKAAFEPAYRAPQPVVPELDLGTDGTAQFDPSMLSESDDPVEALGEIDVPELEVHEPEEPAVVEPDYDLDIDAEMATLFADLPSEPAAAAPAEAEQGFASAFVASGNRAAASTDTFDEFEKALEDDFRTMLSQPLGQPRTLSGTQSQAQAPYAANGGSGGRTLKTILLAACATGVIALVGLGGYMLVSHSGGSSSSAPRIIAADKGPVKVVPENKGGVTVPNQDKAVYDRVAGHEADDVKQSSLVTTEEQPVDVVQKTLSDNTLPVDGDQAQDAAPTPVEDTRDARLLPADTQPATADAGTAAAPAAAPGGVAVRKVRTMIVKADGTLVPREDSPAEQAAAAPGDAAPADTGIAQTADAGAAAPLSTPAATAGADQDLRTTGATTATPAPAGAVQASNDTLASVANSDVAVAPPVRTVKTAAVTDNSSDHAPIPTARPSDQPVNVVSTVTEKGNVKPAAQPQETAAIDQPAATAPAAPSGTYGMQIASLPSEADAKASIKKYAAKFAGVIGGRSIGIRQADIPGKGTYYRLRVDVGTKEQANALCSKLKAAGGSCLVSR